MATNARRNQRSFRHVSTSSSLDLTAFVDCTCSALSVWMHAHIQVAIVPCNSLSYIYLRVFLFKYLHTYKHTNTHELLREFVFRECSPFGKHTDLNVWCITVYAPRRRGKNFMSTLVNNSSSLGSTTGSAVLTGSCCAVAVFLDIKRLPKKEKRVGDFHIKRLLDLARRPADNGSMADPRLKGNEVEIF